MLKVFIFTSEPLIGQGQGKTKEKNARQTEIEEEINIPRFGSMHTASILIQCNNKEQVTKLDTWDKQGTWRM